MNGKTDTTGINVLGLSIYDIQEQYLRIYYFETETL